MVLKLDQDVGELKSNIGHPCKLRVSQLISASHVNEISEAVFGIYAFEV